MRTFICLMEIWITWCRIKYMVHWTVSKRVHNCRIKYMVSLFCLIESTCQKSEKVHMMKIMSAIMKYSQFHVEKSTQNRRKKYNIWLSKKVLLVISTKVGFPLLTTGYNRKYTWMASWKACKFGIFFYKTTHIHIKKTSRFCDTP